MMTPAHFIIARARIRKHIKAYYDNERGLAESEHHESINRIRDKELLQFEEIADAAAKHFKSVCDEQFAKRKELNKVKSELEELKDA